MKMKRSNKPLVIDADYLLYRVTMGNADTGRFFKQAEEGDGPSIAKPVEKKKYRKRFKEKVEEIMESVACNFPYNVDVKADPILVFTDPKGNFRYDIYPEYKSNRKTLHTADFLALRKWAHKKYFVAPHLEADDVVAWYKRHGHLIVTIDKDIAYGVAGKCYNHETRTWTEVTADAAANFTLLQSVMGDTGDGIPGIPGVGEVNARKLLKEFGWTWEGVVKAYDSKGLSEADAILTRRLVGMDQAHLTKKGKWKCKLWTPQK